MATNNDIPNKSTIRKPIASSKPMFTAFFCCSFGNLLDAIEIKIILSTPSTISKNVKVNNAIHASGLEKTSNIKVITVNPGRTATKMRAEAAPAENPKHLPQPKDVLDLFLWSLSADGAKGHGKSLDSHDVLACKEKKLGKID